MADSDNLRKVAPGDKLAFPASTFNAMVDAANYVKNKQDDVNRDALSDTNTDGQIYIKNTSGNDRARFDILCLVAPVFGPDDNLDEFKSGPVMTAVTPTTAQRGQFVVLLEPIAAGQIGRAAVSGTALVHVTAVDTGTYYFADIIDNDATQLQAGGSGAAQVLWRKTGMGSQWALVRLGNGVPVAFPVNLTQTGGSQGSQSSAASWTYRVADLAGNVLATNVSPLSQRPSVGFVIPANFGYAHIAAGLLVLGYGNEVADQEACA